MTLAVSTPIEDGLTLQDKVRYHLRDYGDKNIPITIEQLSTQLGKPKPSVYQVVNILVKNQEIELEKETLENGREKIIGIKLLRLKPSGRTYRQRTEKSGPITRILPQVEVADVTSLEHITDYLHQKLAIEDMRDRAKQVGLKESVISFEVNPLAEEALWALKMYADTKKELEDLQEAHQMMGYDLAAAKRDIEYLKRQLREDTDTMLRNG